MMPAFFHFQHTLDRLFNNCINFYWNSISFSWNRKEEGGGRGKLTLRPPAKTTFKKPSLIRVERCLVDLKERIQQFITDESFFNNTNKYFYFVNNRKQSIFWYGSRTTGKTLDTFSKLTQKTTELNKNILDNKNIIIEAINNMNRITNSNIPRNDNN